MDNQFEALKLEYQLCFRLYAVSRNMTRLYADLLGEFGLTFPQYVIMLVMFEHETMDFKELSDRVDLKTGTMTPIVQKLESMGYLHKEKNPMDGRKINVNLTAEGKALKDEIVRVPYELSRRLGMSLLDYEALMIRLGDLSEKLENAQHNEI